MMKRNFLHLLCIALFSFGLHIKTQAQCTVQIYETPGDSLNLPAIFAIAIDPNDSNAVFSYLWSTGDTTETIYSPTANTAYCVTVMGGGCTATACDTSAGCYLQANNSTQDLYGPSGAIFNILLSSNVTGGIAPYTYEWLPDPNISDLTIENPNATITQSTCFTVKVTDVNGCFTYETSCFNVIDTTYTNCTALIVEYIDSLGNRFLTAEPYDSSYVYIWNDGSTAPTTIPTIFNHTYCVDIIYPDGCVASDCYYVDSTFNSQCHVTVIPAGPLGGQLLAQPDGVYPANVIFLYEWNTGDTTQIINVFNPGIYCVTMTVFGGNGAYCSASACYVSDTNSNPNCAAAYITYYDQNYPNDVFLVNVSQGNDLTYFWDFGDGNTSTDSFPTHTYANYGYYNVCLTVTSIGSGFSCTSTYCDSVGISQALAGKTTSGFNLNVIRNIDEVGIEEQSSIKSVVLYPNPVQNELFLELNTKQSANAIVEVKDVMGRLIKTQTLATQTGFNQVSIDVLDLESGMYFLSFTHNQQTKTMRFLKQ
jgi:PKD repeat protein